MQSMKHFTSLFDSPIWSHDHAGIEQDKLKDYLLYLKSKDKGRVVSNSQGWQSNPLHLQTPELQQFFQAILIDLNYYYKEIKGHTDKYEVMIDQAWANVNTTGAFNWPHAHTGFLSVVYYVEADEDTGLEFTVTSLFRIDDTGVHGTLPLRGIDFRMRDFDIGRLVEKKINEKWCYDSKRSGVQCAVFHDVGKGIHLHIQSHQNTVL